MTDDDGELSWQGSRVEGEGWWGLGVGGGGIGERGGGVEEIREMGRRGKEERWVRSVEGGRTRKRGEGWRK